MVAGALLILMVVVTVDYGAYRHHGVWYNGIARSIYKGMPLADLRAYLETDGPEHGIRRLKEFNQDGRHWFVFDNPNSSTITTLITGGLSAFLQAGVVVWLDGNDHVDYVGVFQ